MRWTGPESSPSIAAKTAFEMRSRIKDNLICINQCGLLGTGFHGSFSELIVYFWHESFNQVEAAFFEAD